MKKESSEENYKTNFLHFITYSLTKVSPNISYKVCLKLLCNPKSRRQYDLRTKINPKSFNVDTKLGPVKLYRFGRGDKHILLTHGWADSTRRFTYLINHLLADNKYSVWSFDHIGHGKSYGNIAHLPGFIDGLRSCTQFIHGKGFKIDCFIAHSMGALALINQDKKVTLGSKKILISSPSKFFEYMFKRLMSLGLSTSTVENFLVKVSDQFNMKWTQLSMKSNLDKIDSSYLFIHDKNDTVCSHNNLVELLKTKENSNYKTMSTENLGHLKILKNETVFHKIKTFINE